MTGRVRRIVASHALAAVGMSLPWPLLLLLVWEQTHSAALLGLAGAARMAPYVLFSWAVGRLADRYPRHLIVLATLGGRLDALAALGLLLAAGQVLAAVVAAAVAVAVATPAYPALAAAMPAAAGRSAHKATNLLVTVEVASFVVGPALGGLLLAPSLQWLVPMLSLAGVVTAAALFGGITLAAPDSSVSGAVACDGVTATLRRSPALVSAIGVVAAVNAVLAAVAIALLPLAEESWGAGGTAYGLASGVLGFGALAGPLLVRIGRDDRARARTGMALLAGCLLVVAPSPALAWAVLPLAVVAAAAVQVESAATGIIQERAPDRVRASVLGVTDTAMVAAAMVGSLVAPLLAAAVGPRVLVLGASALAAGSALLARAPEPAALVPAPERAVSSGRPAVPGPRLAGDPVATRRPSVARGALR